MKKAGIHRVFRLSLVYKTYKGFGLFNLFVRFLREYLLDCKIRNLSQQTIKNKRIQNKVAINYFEHEFGITKLGKVKKVHVKAYLNNKLESDCKASTINTHLKILKSFFAYGVEEGYISVNPAETIKLLKRESL